MNSVIILEKSTSVYVVRNSSQNETVHTFLQVKLIPNFLSLLCVFFLSTLTHIHAIFKPKKGNGGKRCKNQRQTKIKCILFRFITGKTQKLCLKENTYSLELHGVLVATIVSLQPKDPVSSPA